MGNPKVKTPPQLGLVSFPFNLGEDGVHVLLETRFNFSYPSEKPPIKAILKWKTQVGFDLVTYASQGST